MASEQMLGCSTSCGNDTMLPQVLEMKLHPFPSGGTSFCVNVTTQATTVNLWSGHQ